MPTTENRARTELYRRATEEWEDLKKTHRETWLKYRVIGEAIVEARAEIMRKRELNQPAGPGYQQDIKKWLVEHRLDDMHKTTRSHLCDLIDHIDEVDRMMADWSLTDRMEWNAPNTVHRKWQAWRRKQGHTSERQRKKLTTAKQTSDQLAIALERIHELEQELQSAKQTGKKKSPTVDTSTTNKNPLSGYDAGQIVDFILGLKAATVRAIVHDLLRGTATKKPEPESDPAPVKAKTERPDGLVWKDTPSILVPSYHDYEAKTAKGKYDVSALASFPDMKFGGYDLTFYPPDFHPKTNNNKVTIKRYIKTAQQAKAIAEAHFAKS